MTQSDVLLFVPAVAESENQTALRISQLLAQAATKARDGTYTVESSPTTTRSTVRDPAGQAVLHVIQVDYRPALFTAKPRANGSLRDALRALSFAIFATFRLAGSVLTSRRPKCSRAKWQIFIACALVGVLWLGFLFLLVLALELLGVTWLPDWLTDSALGQSTAAAGGAVGLLALFYWRIRDPVIDLGRRLQAIMGYAERQDDLLRVTATVDEALDSVIEEYPDARIHLFGFSFGGVALLDTLFPTRSRHVERRDLGRVATVTTVGCPADFVRLLYPEHYEGRTSRIDNGALWTNMYIPSDVLGSNFLQGGNDIARAPKKDASLTEAPIDSVMPDVNIPVGRQRIPGRRLLLMDGFAIHGRYWALHEPRHLEGLVPTWLPTDRSALTSTPSVAPPVSVPDAGPDPMTA